MFKKSYLISLFLAFSLFLSLAYADNATQPQSPSFDQWIQQTKDAIKKKTLANGITILFYRLPNTVEVELRVTVNVGSRDEHAGQYGLAHMVEHMIFKGTDKMSETDIKRIAEKFGNVQWNATTTNDQTSYYFIADNKNWPVFLSILADSMQNTRFDQEHFDSEVKTVLSELNLHRDSVFGKTLGMFFPAHHPYARTPLGTREDLVNATAKDLKDFYHAHYLSEQTVITIVGNIDPDVVFKETENLFGGIQRSNIKKQPFDNNAFLQTDFIQKHVVVHTRAERPSTALVWLTPGGKNIQSEIGRFLAYCFNERLRPIKDEHNLVYAYGIGQSALFDAGFFVVEYEPKQQENQSAILKLIAEEIQDLAIKGPTEKELTKFKIIEKNSFSQGSEHISFVSYLLNAYCLNNNIYEAFDRFDFLQNLTNIMVKDFCKKYLKPTLINHIDVIPLEEDEKDEWIELQETIDAYEKRLTEGKERTKPVESERLLHQLPNPETLAFDFQQPSLVTTLDNGLDIYIKKQPTTPAVHLCCGFKNADLMNLYHAQQQQEYIPQLAMAQLIEESNGTQNHPEVFNKKEHIDFFDSLGSSGFFYAGGASLSCLASDFQTAAQRLFHILTQPTYPLKPLNIELANAIDQIIQSQQSAEHMASTTLVNYLYQQYPWTYTDTERIEHLKTYTRNDLVAFHQTWVNPNTMYIVLVGNIEPEDAKDALEQVFGSWQPKSTSTQDMLSSVTIPAITNPTAHDIKNFVPNEQVVLYAGRLSTMKGTQDGYALMLLESYLNRMLFNIREQTGIFYYCHASLSPVWFITCNNISITTVTMPHNIEQAKQAIKAVLAELYQNGVTQEYLNTEKQCAAMTLAKSFATSSSFASAYSYITSNNLSFDYYNQALEKIQALTLDTVNAVAKKYCNPDGWSFVQAGRIAQHAAT